MQVDNNDIINQKFATLQEKMMSTITSMFAQQFSSLETTLLRPASVEEGKEVKEVQNTRRDEVEDKDKVPAKHVRSEIESLTRRQKKKIWKEESRLRAEKREKRAAEGGNCIAAPHHQQASHSRENNELKAAWMAMTVENAQLKVRNELLSKEDLIRQARRML